MTKRDSEKVRREQAQQLSGEVISESGKSIEPKSLEQMISVRLDTPTITLLRDLAESQRVSVSSLIRTAVADFAARSGQVTKIRWQVIRSEGTDAVETREWQESPSSRAGLREIREGELAV